MKSVFPNIEIALRLYLTLMVSNCKGEMSFSRLKMTKNQLRSAMDQKRLNNLSIMSIENDILKQTLILNLLSYLRMYARLSLVH